MPGRRPAGGERRRDPTDPQSTKTYTQAQFAQFYGPQNGPRMWKKAGGSSGGKGGGKGGGRAPPPLKAAPGRRPRYAVGQKVRATGRLTGDRGQVVNRGAVGVVTAVPGAGVRLERGAVAEVKISGVTFDASPDMINPADQPMRPRQPRMQRAPPAPARAPRSRRPAPRAPPRPRQARAAPRRAQKAAPKAERRPDPTMKPNQKGANKTYTKAQFVSFYGPQAKQMWIKAGKKLASAGSKKGKKGEERRKDPTMKKGQKGADKTYTRQQFAQFYGPADAKKVWAKAGQLLSKKGGAEERRKDPTMKKGQKGADKTYTKQQFVAFYGPDAKKVWAAAGKTSSKKGGKAAKKEAARPDPSTKSKKTYTLAQFKEFYGKKAGQKLWDMAGKKDKKGKKGDKKGKKADKKGKASPKKEKKEKKPKKDRGPRPPPSKPVMIKPRAAPKTALGANLKCEEEGSTLMFDFKADGSILAGEQALMVTDGAVAFGTISGEPTDSQKWSLSGGRLKCGDKVLAYVDGGVAMQEEKEKEKTQAWSFSTGEKKEKKEKKKKAPAKGKKGEKRADPTETNGKKYSEQEFIKFYGSKNGAMLWKQAGKKAKGGKKGGKGGKAKKSKK